MKSPKIKLIKIAIIAFILTGLSASISLSETSPSPDITDELIARKNKKHDSSLAISVEAVLYKIRHNQMFTLVDVRSKQDFEELHIPGSVNIPLHAVKTKTFLKSATLVLVNEGFRYTELEDECRRLVKRGFDMAILDGGLPAWKRKGGRLVGDLFALEAMKTVAPRAFFREKDYENTLIIDFSSTRSEASIRLIPFAKHIPVLDDRDGSAAELKKLISNNRLFQSIVLFNETGEHYEKAELILNRMGIEAFSLKGGLAGYQKYVEGLLLSWQPRDSRMKTISKCKLCGEKAEDE